MISYNQDIPLAGALAVGLYMHPGGHCPVRPTPKGEGAGEVLFYGLDMKKVRPIRIDGNVAYVTLTKNQIAIIDAEDVDLVSGFNWCSHGKTVFYAARGASVGHKKTKILFMHRLIAKTPDGMDTDHINGNTLDNRKENLRHATSSQNKHNQKARATNKSGFKGVSWAKKAGKWTAQICCHRKTKNLGYFDCAKDAHQAYCDAARLLHGDFARVL